MSAYQYFEVIDLSATGAKLRGPAALPLGRTALFRLEGYQALCRVVWTDNDLCGVRFDEIIPARVLEQIQDAGATATVGMLPSDEHPVEEA